MYFAICALPVELKPGGSPAGWDGIIPPARLEDKLNYSPDYQEIGRTGSRIQNSGVRSRNSEWVGLPSHAAADGEGKTTKGTKNPARRSRNQIGVGVGIGIGIESTLDVPQQIGQRDVRQDSIPIPIPTPTPMKTME